MRIQSTRPFRAAIAPLRLDLIEETEFWGWVDRDDPDPDACWYWIGRGIRWVGEPGTITRGGHPMAAYRVAYSLAYGEPSNDREIHHTCRQRGCCRPAHLVALTLSEHRAVHRGGINTALIKMFGAELPPWSFLEILDTEMLERAEWAPPRSTDSPPRNRFKFSRHDPLWAGVALGGFSDIPPISRAT